MTTTRRPAGSGGQRAAVERLVRPVVTGAGYDLEEVRISRAGKRSLVRVVVDRDGGIDLDAVAAVSRAVSGALDGAADGGVGGLPYTLEVTSPGVDRPLTESRHWRRNIGRLVSTRVGDQPLTGRIVAVDEHSVRLSTGSRDITAQFAELGAGKIEIEFRRSADGQADGTAGVEEGEA
jgi:ribosome maturation factor RimP